MCLDVFRTQTKPRAQSMGRDNRVKWTVFWVDFDSAGPSSNAVIMSCWAIVRQQMGRIMTVLVTQQEVERLSTKFAFEKLSLSWMGLGRDDPCLVAISSGICVRFVWKWPIVVGNSSNMTTYKSNANNHVAIRLHMRHRQILKFMRFRQDLSSVSRRNRIHKSFVSGLFHSSARRPGNISKMFKFIEQAMGGYYSRGSNTKKAYRMNGNIDRKYFARPQDLQLERHTFQSFTSIMGTAVNQKLFYSIDRGRGKPDDFEWVPWRASSMECLEFESKRSTPDPHHLPFAHRVKYLGNNVNALHPLGHKHFNSIPFTTQRTKRKKQKKTGRK